MLVSGLVGLGGCAGVQPSEAPLPSGTEAEAVIRPAYARFVFPEETVQEFTWNAPAAEASPGMPEFGWDVYWAPPWERVGKDPHAIWAIVYWRPGGIRRGDLRTLLEGWKPMVMTACVECGTPASISHEDSSITLRVADNRVVFTVKGATAIKRLFPTAPHTVVFARMRKSGAVEDTVAVKR